MENILNKSIITLCTCFIITTKTNDVYYLTDNVEDLTINKHKFKSNKVISYTNLEKKDNLISDDYEIKILFDNSFLSKSNIIALKKFENANIKCLLVDYKKPNQNIIILSSGYLSDLQINDLHFTYVIKSYESSLLKKINPVYSINCRAKFADQFCKADKEKFTFYGKISKIIDENNFIDTNRVEDNDYFQYGILEFLSGKNKGLIYEVATNANKKITLIEPVLYDMNINDKYKIRAGCDKSIKCCAEKFDNVINFRGEPFITKKSKIYE